MSRPAASPRAPSPFGRKAVFLLVLALAWALSGCVTPPKYRKPSFVGQGGVDEEAEETARLNNLSSCAYGTPAWTGEAKPKAAYNRVLISRPDGFSAQGGAMLWELNRALIRFHKKKNYQVELVMAAQPLKSAGQAVKTGLACGAMMVLWEKQESRVLELTLPRPPRLPVPGDIQESLCEFGDHSEQLSILFNVIVALSALEAGHSEEARLYLSRARAIDNHCVHLPGQ